MRPLGAEPRTSKREEGHGEANRTDQSKIEEQRRIEHRVGFEHQHATFWRSWHAEASADPIPGGITGGNQKDGRWRAIRSFPFGRSFLFAFAAQGWRGTFTGRAGTETDANGRRQDVARARYAVAKGVREIGARSVLSAHPVEQFVPIALWREVQLPGEPHDDAHHLVAGRTEEHRFGSGTELEIQVDQARHDKQGEIAETEQQNLGGERDPPGHET